MAVGGADAGRGGKVGVGNVGADPVFVRASDICQPILNCESNKCNLFDCL